MLVADLETPAIVVDLDVMERNLSRMAEYCRNRNLRLRPHTKSHKIPELAKRQLAHGARGITVAKIGEAEVMLDAGIADMLIAYPIVGTGKAEKLADLATRANITVALDSVEVARAVSAEAKTRDARVGILVELDVGFRRCGVTNEDQALTLARSVADLPGLEFKGLMFFPGHLQVSESERAKLRISVNDFLSRSLAKLEAAGLPVEIVSGGSTPTAREGHLFTGVNEIRPGMYIFNDRNMLGVGVAQLEDCALSVITTVVSTSVPGRAIVDAGSKTLSSDRHEMPDGKGFGMIKTDPDAEVERLSEEHGNLNIARSRRQYRVGERLEIIPNHVCSTVNMHNRIYGVSGGRVETVWEVAGRGKVQ
ncbi:MAG TPA: alanine racemase [Pyrinomonadaceae bacterium]|nr:alanine racemase [Pyrinomonadaceae bacterium]